MGFLILMLFPSPITFPRVLFFPTLDPVVVTGTDAFSARKERKGIHTGRWVRPKSSRL